LHSKYGKQIKRNRTMQLFTNMRYNMSELPVLCSYRQSRVVQLLMIYFWVMVFNTTFNNISVISWQSIYWL